MWRWGLALAWSIPIMLGLMVAGVVSVPGFDNAGAAATDCDHYEFPGGL